MGFRFRKSFTIMPGVKLNFSKTGIGGSVGIPGFRLTKRADGKVQTTSSIPGTGLSYVKTHSPKRKKRKNQGQESDFGNSTAIDLEPDQIVLPNGAPITDSGNPENLPEGISRGIMFGVTQDGMFLDLDALNRRSLRSLSLALLVSLATLALMVQPSTFAQVEWLGSWIVILPGYLLSLDCYVHAWVSSKCTDQRAGMPKKWSFMLLVLLPLAALTIGS